MIADATHDFFYDNLNRTFRQLFEGAHLQAVADNRYFREADGKYRDGDERHICAPGACVCVGLYEAVQGVWEG